MQVALNTIVNNTVNIGSTVINNPILSSLAVGVATVAFLKFLQYAYQNHKISNIISEKKIVHPYIPQVTEGEVKLNKSNPKPEFTCKVFNKDTCCWEIANVFYRVVNHEHNFAAISSLDGTYLGQITVLKYDEMNDGTFGCPAYLCNDDIFSRYPDEENLVPKIEIKELKNNCIDKYKYVGYNLLKIAMQKFKDVEFRADLSAGWNSHTFWWKFGFRPNEKREVHRIAAQVLEGRTNKDLMAVKMHLPQWARENWKSVLV